RLPRGPGPRDGGLEDRGRLRRAGARGPGGPGGAERVGDRAGLQARALPDARRRDLRAGLRRRPIAATRPRPTTPRRLLLAAAPLTDRLQGGGDSTRVTATRGGPGLVAAVGPAPKSRRWVRPDRATVRGGGPSRGARPRRQPGARDLPRVRARRGGRARGGRSRSRPRARLAAGS